MIRVTVELVSAVTGKTTKLGEMTIANDGIESRENPKRGSYIAVLRGKRNADMGSARVVSWPRQARNVWDLVQFALFLLRDNDWRKGSATW